MTSSKRPKQNNFNTNGDLYLLFCTRLNCGTDNATPMSILYFLKYLGSTGDVTILPGSKVGTSYKLICALTIISPPNNNCKWIYAPQVSQKGLLHRQLWFSGPWEGDYCRINYFFLFNFATFREMWNRFFALGHPTINFGAKDHLCITVRSEVIQFRPFWWRHQSGFYDVT